MFIPHTSPIHKDLATSFVLVEALVDDLCQGGFSGVVEIRLRDTDYSIIVWRGEESLVVEGGDKSHPSKATISDLAVRAQKERGLVSVYQCSHETSGAVIGCMRARILYNRLSTEFADLEKMVHKLKREEDRDWYVEIETESGVSGLVHIDRGFVHAVASSGEPSEGEGALRFLLTECSASGGTFSVYFRTPGEDSAHEPAAAEPVATAEEASEVQAEVLREADAGGDAPVEELHGAAVEAGLAAPEGPAPAIDPEPAEPIQPATPSKSRPKVAALKRAAQSRRTGDPGGLLAEPEPFVMVVADPSGPLPGAEARINGDAGGAAGLPEAISAATSDRSTAESAEQPRLSTGDLRSAEAMSDVKRLMADIASTIEKSAREIEPRDTFSIYLRAGQLKIADRYPFLDPFGSEFEYHAGEIAFIGKVGPEVFIEGLTEALRLAVRSVIEASSQPTKLQSRIDENLGGLLNELGPELQAFELDQSIQRIMS